MREFDWSRVGVPSVEAERLTRVSRGCDEFTLGRELAQWDQYVAEVTRGELWLLVELEAACHARDDLELTLALVQGESLVAVCRVVDEMDLAFREGTVAYGALWPDREILGRWWWGRVPVRTMQRLYLFEDQA